MPANPPTRYRPNIAGLGQLMKGPAMQAGLAQAARRGQVFAEAISPVQTGAYRSSFRVAVRVGTDRARAELHNDSDHALVVEFQNDSRVLRRTVDEIERG